ncbi:WD40 repeat domain-containing protein [Nostoc sp. MS1]|uniref:WD40 repeat domain-containing protein n=1 Tax=Nostoc sp. MS1 TaxID=2764711 RepID=UPI001CC6A7E3|nr:WD40 repeat domain-containing protein [Nostoc sp. MS1]BCL39480.1 hypothetical protein NSMS1_59270 [Nostoc sp. MS1]
MEPGLKLLIQLVLEFAPVFVTILNKRSEEALATTKEQLPTLIEGFIETVYTFNDNNAEKSSAKETLQQQLAAYQRETQTQIANQQRDTALKLPEVNKILDNWPLRLYPSQILESHHSYGHKPLKVFIAPPKIQFDQFDNKTETAADIESMLAEGLRNFINKNYSFQNLTRPIEFLAGAWDSKRFHSESSIKALYGMLKTEPILILESENDGDYLNFRIAYWGLGQGTYYYKTISRLSYKEIVQNSAKKRALEWKQIRDELLEIGAEVEEINQLGQDNIFNLALLEKAEKWQAQGIDISKLSLQYRINQQDIEQLCQVLITCHCLVAGWVADIYHLVNYDVPPLLPELLPSLLKDAIDLQSLQAFATSYKQVYEALEKQRLYWIPELSMQLAQSLSHLSDSSWAQTEVEYSITTWLELRQVSLQQFTHPLEAMQSAVKIEDEEYIQKLRKYFTAIDDRTSLQLTDKLIDAIATLKYKRSLESPNLSKTITGHSGKVTSIAISPDGEVLVSGCTEQAVNIWNFPTGKLIRTLTGNLGEVSSVAISPDGNFLAVGSGVHPRSNVKVWHLTTGKLLHTLLGHQKPVNVVVISPDGQLLASGSNKIKIWNLQKGDRICTLWHSSAVHAVAMSKDGTVLASGSSDNKIRLWNPRTGDPIRTLNKHDGEVKAIAISPDGQFLFSGSADTTIKIWHLITGQVLHTLTGHTADVTSLATSPNGQYLFSGSADTTIKIWRISTGELLHTLTGHSATVNSVAVSPDNNHLASGSADQTIKIWQIDKI